MKTLKVFEAFAGYGSQRMALRNLAQIGGNLNYESVGILEIDPHAILSYANIHDNLNSVEIEYPTKEEMFSFLENKNIGCDFKTGKVKLPKQEKKLKDLYRATVLSKNFGDVCLINPKDLPDMDLFTYSFPCTDISVAGKQEGIVKGQTRSGLLYECEKIIETKRPKYLLLENVKNLVGKQFKSEFDEWLKYLETLGYSNYWQVLNAKHYGIPQNRERVFVVSILNDENEDYTFPQGKELDSRLKSVLETQVEDKYYLSEEIQKRFKPSCNFGQGNIVGTTAPEFRTIGQRDLCYQENSVMGTLVATDYKQPKQIVEKISNDLKEEKHIIGIPQATKEGYIEMELPGICDLTYPNSKTRRGRVQDKGACCPTLTTGKKDVCYIDVHGDEYRVRRLTPLECWRLMGCSDEDFYKAQEYNSDTQLYKQAGNSIVVPVLEGIFKQLFMK